MKKQSFVSFGLATFAGIVVGGLLTQAISEHVYFGNVLWIFGALVGGMVGYIGVDVRGFVTSVRKNISHIRTRGPQYMLMKYVALGVMNSLLCAVSFSGIALLDSLTNSYEQVTKVMFVIGITVCSATTLFVMSTLPLFKRDIRESTTDQVALREMKKTYDQTLGVLAYMNVFGLFRLLWLVIRWMPTIIKVAGSVCMCFVAAAASVVYTTYKEVHSSARVSAFVSAALFSAVTYMFEGNVLVFAVAGMVFGLVEYSLVSPWIVRFCDWRIAAMKKYMREEEMMFE